MACEKYSGWMTDAALGALQPGQEREFRSHVALCDKCRGEWEAAMALASAVSGAVESLVAGQPSPQFAARLRARIADEPAPAAWLFLTWPALSAGALAAAAVLLAALLIRSPERIRPTAETVANNLAPVVKPASAQANLSPAAVGATPPSMSRRVPARRPSDAAPFSFEVLVPAGQLSAALLLSEAAGDGRIDGVQLTALAEEARKPLEVKALEVAPLETPGTGESDNSVSPQGAGRI
jgi:hypothetical protein